MARAEAGTVSAERSRGVRPREGCGQCRPEDRAGTDASQPLGDLDYLDTDRR